MLCITVFYSCSEKPDVIYTNGKIYTLNSGNIVAEAMAIKDGKILDVGTSADINDDYSSEEVVDLKGAVVLPGFIDSEGSIIEFSKNLNFINLSYAKNIDEIKNLILQKVKNTNEGEWIGGYGWNELIIPQEDLEIMSKEILDEVAPNYNVYLVNASLNTVWVNSRLLRYLKIDKDTPSPENGEIEKDGKGEPTGLLYDDAVNLVKDNVPGLLKNEMLVQVEKGLKEISKYGITQVHDRTVGMEGLEIFKELIDSKKFPIKVYAVLSGEDSSLIETYLSKGVLINYGDRLTIRAITLDYDGQFELQDAAMNDEFKSEPKKRSLMLQKMI
ncbi:MAG: amidohydrolase family protein [Ignavibacteria bacterium]|nr:amidohydrolase family protein [Ignavibacteria bacterium]